MKELSAFQLILLTISGFIIVIGVVMFAFTSSKASKEAGLVTVWGTIPEEDFEQVNNYLKDKKEIKQTISYLYIEPKDFDNTLTTALAEGGGPDVVMLTDDKLVRHEGKLFVTSFEFYPERLFKDTFLEAGEIFLTKEGVVGFPLLVDPMVMYWNRTLFTETGQSLPPKYWDELLTLVPDLTQKDSNREITKSAIAMGDYQNIKHAKELLTTLLLQAGDEIVERNLEYEPGVELFTVVFDDKFDFTVAPAIAAVNFYTQFANPSRAVYTWNRSRDNSLDAFVAGDVAVYFGFASEFSTIRQKNPNLNFDVAVIPQSRTGQSATYGKVLALAIPKNSQNIVKSYPFIQTMIQPETVSIISDILFLPPVRRDLLAGDSGNAFMQTFHNSALLAKNVYDLNPEESNNIFREMIESVVSGKLTTSEAVLRANQELELLLP